MNIDLTASEAFFIVGEKRYIFNGRIKQFLINKYKFLLILLSLEISKYFKQTI